MPRDENPEHDDVDYKDEISDDYEDSDDYEQEYHASTYQYALMQNPDPLTVMEAKKVLSNRAEECTWEVWSKQCEAREFHFLELFRANYTLGERLEKMVGVESTCKKQTKEMMKMEI